MTNSGELLLEHLVSLLSLFDQSIVFFALLLASDAATDPADESPSNRSVGASECGASTRPGNTSGECSGCRRAPFVLTHYCPVVSLVRFECP